jgi:hypothetical protein
MGTMVYQNRNNESEPTHQNIPDPQAVNGGDSNSMGRSVLSMKFAAQAIKRKASNNSTAAEYNQSVFDNRVQEPYEPTDNRLAKPAIIDQNYGNTSQPLRTKNVPNGLLRRATGGA